MDQYTHYYIEKQRYIKDTKEIFYAGFIGIGFAYFLLTRETFPVKYEYTWKFLITFYLLAFYMGISFISGWRLLNRMTSNIFLALPIVGWLIFFFLKIAGALFIGGSCFYSLIRLGNNFYNIYDRQSLMDKELKRQATGG